MFLEDNLGIRGVIHDVNRDYNKAFYTYSITSKIYINIRGRKDEFKAIQNENLYIKGNEPAKTQNLVNSKTLKIK